MSAGGHDPGEKIAAKSSEPGKESGGGPSTTDKSSLSPALIVALIGAAAVVAAAVLGPVVTHALNSAASVPSHAAAPPQPEPSGDTPVVNCRTCISGPGGQTFTEQAGGGSAKPTFRNPLVFGGQGQSVQPHEKVEVVCRFFQPNADPSVRHDGWWYLIASQPWNRQYYTVANANIQPA